MVEKPFYRNHNKLALVFRWLPPPLTHTPPLDETVFETQILLLLPSWQQRRSHMETMCIDENKLCLLTLEPHVMYPNIYNAYISSSARYKVTCVVTNLNYLNSPPHKFSTHVNLDYYTRTVDNTLISSTSVILEFWLTGQFLNSSRLTTTTATEEQHRTTCA